MGNFLKKILFQVGHRAIGAMTLVMMLMVLLTVVDVTLRRVFNSPLAFSLELMELGLVIVVWGSVLYSTSRERHISIDVLVTRFPVKARRFFRLAFDLVSALLLFLIGWQSVIYAMGHGARFRESATLGVPIFPFILIVAFGTIWAGLMLLADFINSMRGEAEP